MKKRTVKFFTLPLIATLALLGCSGIDPDRPLRVPDPEVEDPPRVFENHPGVVRADCDHSHNAGRWEEFFDAETELAIRKAFVSLLEAEVSRPWFVFEPPWSHLIGNIRPDDVFICQFYGIYNDSIVLLMYFAEYDW